MEYSRPKVQCVQMPRSEGGNDTCPSLEMHWAWVAQVGILAKCLISAGLLRNSQVPLGCQPEDQRRLWCTHTRRWPESSTVIAGQVSGQEFHDASQEPLGIGHGSTDHIHVKQRHRSHLTSACQKARGEVGRGLLSSPGISHTPEAGPLRIPTLDTEMQPTTIFLLPGNHLLSRNLFRRKHILEYISTKLRALNGRVLEFCGKILFPSILCILLAPHFPKGSRSCRL